MNFDDDENTGTGSGSHNHLPHSEEDLHTLPKATISKLIMDQLQDRKEKNYTFSCPKETKDLISECSVEFIQMLSSESNDICERMGKKTISPEHVIEALRNLGYEDMLEEVRKSMDDAVMVAKEKCKSKAKSNLDNTGFTAEELEEQQEILFAAARLKYQQQNEQNSPNK